MSEPTSTAAGAGIALGAVTVTGTILGMQIDALLIGCAAAMVVLLNQAPISGAPRTPLSVFGFVAGASLAAGIGAPLAVLVATDQWEILRGLDGQALRILAAGLIGATTHLAAPAARDLLPGLLERLRGVIGGRP